MVRLRLWETSGMPMLRQTVFLFAVDMAANVVDYAFHVYLGRALVPGDFAVFQTVNSALLIVITATGVMQPVVARFVAEGEMQQGGHRTGAVSRGSAALFREYLGWSTLVGGILAGAVWLGRGFLSKGLNVPPFAVQFGIGVVFLVLLRPVVVGVLQGAQRFVSFGAVRLAYALGRFAVAGLLLYWGWGLRGAVASLPVGQLLAVGCGLGLLGIRVWKRSPPPLDKRNGRLMEGLRLAGWAFLAYSAHTALLNNDMLFVNRIFAPDEAGIYAAVVLLRRILLLLPGAAVVVLYPRVAATVTQKKLPDREIIGGVRVVSGLVGVLVAIYFAAGEPIARLVFGEPYAAAGPLLGWVGLGIWGYGLGTIWLNVFLATRPGPFVGLLVGMVVLQGVGMAEFSGALPGVVGVFSVIGWGLALGGGILYAVWLRPRLVQQFERKEDE
ncbi:MAG TPA: hypothetical protein VI451_09130 [Anaerolineales bacterium]|nr:hypothetical protein [Anaerolineales bacterium]